MATADDAASAAVACAWCGATAPDGPPLGWTLESSERGVQALCPACTRINVRAIESKLDTEWW